MGPRCSPWNPEGTKPSSAAIHRWTEGLMGAHMEEVAHMVESHDDHDQAAQGID